MGILSFCRNFDSLWRNEILHCIDMKRAYTKHDTDSDEDIWDYKSQKVTKNSQSYTCTQAVNERSSRGVIAQRKLESQQNHENNKQKLEIASQKLSKRDKGKQQVLKVDTKLLTLPQHEEQSSRENISTQTETQSQTSQRQNKVMSQSAKPKKLHQTQQEKTDTVTDQDIHVSSSQAARQVPKNKKTPKFKTPPVRKKHDGNCPFCQMPFRVLTIESPRWHVMECMDLPLIAKEGILGVCNVVVPHSLILFWFVQKPVTICKLSLSYCLIRILRNRPVPH